MAKRRRLVSEEFWRWSDATPQFTGTLTEITSYTFGDREIVQYTFTRAGSDVRMNATDQLVKAMSNVLVGEEVEINYEGTQRTGSGYDVQLFKVYVLEDDPDDA